MENSSLWIDFKGGCRKAYEHIIRTFYPELYRYGMRLVDNSEFVKDSIHDLFVHIWERRAFLGNTDNIRLYLLKSLRHRILRELERESRHSFLDEDRVDEDYIIRSREEEIAISEEIIRQKRKLGYSLRELTDRQREVIHLRYYEDLSNADIAVVMNISKPAVANLLHASLKALRIIWYTSKIILMSIISSI